MNYDYSTIDDILGSLPIAHQKVIRWRYGIGAVRTLLEPQRGATHGYDRLGPNSHTLKEIAETMGFRTRERVRQIEEEALEKIRHPSRLPSFEALFENNLYSPGVIDLAKAVLGPDGFSQLKYADENFPELAPVKAKGPVTFRPVRSSAELA